MSSTICRALPVCVLCTWGLTLLAGCSQSEPQRFTRMHLANGSDATLVFLAIETSEMEASSASNRLAKPLPPETVYSAVLPHPGNYWVRTETEVEGAIVRRIEGPVRLAQGIVSWEYRAEDAEPLYAPAAAGSSLATAISSR